MWRRSLIVCFVVTGIAFPALAGPFRKATKPEPSEHVPALLAALKTDKDEKVRANAASELREYDGKEFPDIVPALAEALSNDPSSSVRAEAAEAIGKVRPVSSKAGYALEQAIANDKSMSVRLSARTAMLQYRILGYFSGAKTEAVLAQTGEPPLAALTTPRGSMSNSVIRPIPSQDLSPIPAAPPSVSPRTEPPQAKGFLSRSKPTNQVGTKMQSSEPPIAARVPTPAPPKVARLPEPKPISVPAVVIPSPEKTAPILTSQPKTSKERPVLVLPPSGPTLTEPPAIVPTPPTTPVVAPLQLPLDVTKPAEKPTGPALEGPALGSPK